MKQPVDQSVDGLFRFRIELGYDGTDYSGWAKQPGRPSVQADVLRALGTLFGETKNDFGMRVAGRTDAGVHALHQVIQIELTPAQLKRIGRSKELVSRLNTMLPPAIRIYSFDEAPAGFDARFSATSRRYRYRIADLSATRNPLEARFTLWPNYFLDEKLMHEAAQQLVGLHDFVAYSKPRLGSTTIRQVREITVTRRVDLGNILEIELEADAFCHNMVRGITGALIKVGSGRLGAEVLGELLSATKRSSEFKVVQPHGLTLIRVNYPADEQLANQADATRKRRTLEEKEGLTE